MPATSRPKIMGRTTKREFIALPWREVKTSFPKGRKVVGAFILGGPKSTVIHL